MRPQSYPIFLFTFYIALISYCRNVAWPETFSVIFFQTILTWTLLSITGKALDKIRWRKVAFKII